jgi:4-hydroxybenzoyl-CoA reductase subunit beta
MILPKLAYEKAANLSEAVRLFQKYDGKGLYFGGGTDIVPRLKLRLHQPKALIDLKGVEDLKGTTVRDGRLSIGAGATLFELKENPIVKDSFPALFESLNATSCETLQMRGTVGGNILQGTRCLFYNQSLEWRTAKGFCFRVGGETCNAVPNARACFANYCSDNALSLLTLSAELTLWGVGGERRVPIADIFSGNSVTPFKVSPDEILVRVVVPLRKTKGAYEKLRVRDSMDYPLVAAAVSVEAGGGMLAVGAVGASPLVYRFENVGTDTAEKIAGRVYSDARPVANATLPAPYRKKMAKVLATRVIARAIREERP